MPSALPSDTSITNSKSPPEPASAVDIIITLAINPENKEQVEANLLKAGEWIEKNEPGCLQWEVFYLEATGEMVLVERSAPIEPAVRCWVKLTILDSGSTTSPQPANTTPKTERKTA